MKKLFEFVVLFLLIITSAFGYGFGFSRIYEFGIRDMLMPIYELPSIPLYSFTMLVLVVSAFRSLYGKDKKSYKVWDPEPYALMFGRIATLYVYLVIILLFNYIYHI